MYIQKLYKCLFFSLNFNRRELSFFLYIINTRKVTFFRHTKMPIYILLLIILTDIFLAKKLFPSQVICIFWTHMYTYENKRKINFKKQKQKQKKKWWYQTCFCQWVRLSCFGWCMSGWYIHYFFQFCLCNMC